MQYIENTDMEQITMFLTNKELGPYLLNGKVEAFLTSAEKVPRKKMSYLEEFLADEKNKKISKTDKESANRTRSYSTGSCQNLRRDRRRSSSLGDLHEASTQRLLSDLTTTMSESFPDYDFANSKLEQFSIREPNEVMHLVNGHFAELTVHNPSFLGKLWQSIDDIIVLKKCEVFSYSPDSSDENVYENMWSFNYFFYNKESKHLVFLTCAASSKLRKVEYDYQSDMDDEECDDYDDDDNRMEDQEDDDLDNSQIVTDALRMNDDEDSDGGAPQWDGVI